MCVSPSVLIFRFADHISGVSETGVVEFCTQVAYVKCYSMDDRPPQKGRCEGCVISSYFDVCSHISGTAEASVAKFCTQVE